MSETFEYKNASFTAKNLEAASCQFLDEAWGVRYVEYLKNKGLPIVGIGAVKDLEDLKEDGYYRLIQKLENGTIFKIEVWQKEDGNSEGLAQVIEG
ncbi:hypothetical protein CKN73_01385 [Carnobacterium divergens]|uniref:hypothetical protein n=1 Tax=Carnobacterium divergens TaxID=2748 RepID=UPI001071E08A|nr:hypothetical protein [Carnobacterium divergens]TFJ45124.1 hypothetical protein CKN77_01380 [Carnobacterium divergens]TFJ52193.1 hypothetical protein CKN73_01385 [Carnobacterium divergens]TFJ57770.1 hypothetical protein CKN83_01380 [Carnobacterium divergens]TFJ65785.1 hypothetical protein CKN89_01385 [Carnobacterium divergens]TFJ74090.1 hypothetical protein CKN91_01380 [Carnobacterium divergens]